MVLGSENVNLRKLVIIKKNTDFSSIGCFMSLITLVLAFDI